MKITHHPAPVPVRIAVCADFHSRSAEMYVGGILELVRRESPALILCPGDFFNNADTDSLRDCHNGHGLDLLTGLAALAPTFYTIGNHEHGMSDENRALLDAAGVTFLDNRYVRRDGLCIGGIAWRYERHGSRWMKAPDQDTAFLDAMEREDGCKILLCHHPEHWSGDLNRRKLTLTVSGHAHGGQWRFFRRGVYAPGQGLFPKYVGGIYRENGTALAVSRGMTNTVKVPRFGNPCEIMMLVPEK